MNNLNFITLDYKLCKDLYLFQKKSNSLLESKLWKISELQKFIKKKSHMENCVFLENQ